MNEKQKAGAPKATFNFTGIFDAVLTLGVFLAAAVPIALIGYWTKSDSAWLSSVGEVFCLSVVALFIRLRFHRNIIDREVISVAPLVTYAMILLAVIGMLLMWPPIEILLQRLFRMSQATRTNLSSTFRTKDPYGTFILVVIIGPAVEELLFRGIILRNLLERYSALTGIMLSALLFAIYHLNPWELPTEFLFGLLVGLVYLWTSSILPGLAAHCIYNGIWFLLRVDQDFSKILKIGLPGTNGFYQFARISIGVILILGSLLVLYKRKRQVL